MKRSRFCNRIVRAREEVGEIQISKRYEEAGKHKERINQMLLNIITRKNRVDSCDYMEVMN